MFRVLGSLPPQLFPIYRIYVMLCDFLTKSYDIGGVISAMALSSLFILMTQHGPEYPNFYEKLYLLVPSMFMAKHRAKFSRGRDQQAAMERMQIGSSWYSNRTCRRFGGFLGRGSSCCFLQEVGC